MLKSVEVINKSKRRNRNKWLNFTGVVCILILVFIMFIYVLAIVPPGCSYRIWFYKIKSVPNKIREADVSSANNFCNHSIFQDAIPRVFLHQDLREASLPASFYGKPKEIGTEMYPITVLKEAVRQYRFSTTVENMLTAYNQQFYWKTTPLQVFLIGFSRYLE